MLPSHTWASLDAEKSCVLLWLTFALIAHVAIVFLLYACDMSRLLQVCVII